MKSIMVTSNKPHKYNKRVKQLSATMNDLNENAIAIIKHQFDATQLLIEEYPNKPLNTGIVNLAQWVYEHNHGKPKQAIEQKMELEFSISPELLAQRRRELDQDSMKLLDMGGEICDL